MKLSEIIIVSGLTGERRDTIYNVSSYIDADDEEYITYDHADLQVYRQYENSENGELIEITAVAYI